MCYSTTAFILVYNFVAKFIETQILLGPLSVAGTLTPIKFLWFMNLNM